MNLASDRVRPGFLEKGKWRKKKIAKDGKGKSEKTKKSRIYFAKAPLSGWPGGRPEDNGFRPRGGK